MGQQKLPEEISCLPGQLGGHVVDGTDEHAWPLEGLLVLVVINSLYLIVIYIFAYNLVVLCIVETEGLINAGALVHELNGAPRVSGDVRDGNQSTGQLG